MTKSWNRPKDAPMYNKCSSEMEKDLIMLNNLNFNTNCGKLKKVGPLPHLSTFHYEIESSGIPIIPKPGRMMVKKKKETVEKRCLLQEGTTTACKKEVDMTLNENESDPHQSMKESQLKLFIDSDSNSRSVESLSTKDEDDPLSSSKHSSNSCCFSHAVSSQNSCPLNSVATSKNSEEELEQKMKTQQHHDPFQSSNCNIDGNEEQQTRQEEALLEESNRSKKKSEILMLQQRRLNLLLWSNTSSKVKSKKHEDFGTIMLEQDDVDRDNLLKSLQNTDEEEATKTSVFFEDKDEQQQWVEYWDEEVKANYYYNILTGEATWVVPSSYKSYST